MFAIVMTLHSLLEMAYRDNKSESEQEGQDSRKRSRTWVRRQHKKAARRSEPLAPLPRAEQLPSRPVSVSLESQIRQVSDLLLQWRGALLMVNNLSPESRREVLLRLFELKQVLLSLKERYLAETLGIKYTIHS
jgi:hypothetical protein